MNIPCKKKLKRVVVIGGGFGGLELVKHLNNNKFQIILIDKNNYSTFQPLLYQVATFGLESESVSTPIRSIFKNRKNFYFRIANVHNINPSENKIFSNIGELDYDYLVFATGSKTNFFGNKNIEYFSTPMKSVNEALKLRNLILQNFEKSLSTSDFHEKDKLMTFVVVGGGPTGVELAGALAELKQHILPYDYPDLDISRMKIYLIQASSRLLETMSIKSSKIALKYLSKMGVIVWLNAIVDNYDGNIVHIGTKYIASPNIIWAAGVTGSLINGIKNTSIERGRFIVNSHNLIKGYKNIFAIGDVAIMKTNKYPLGHPMMAQPAIQQGRNLSKNLNYLLNNVQLISFKYRNLGSMAIIGRNKAVCELFVLKIKGFLAWIIWIIIHIISVYGFRNKIIVFVNFLIQYFQYNKCIRLIIHDSDSLCDVKKK